MHSPAAYSIASTFTDWVASAPVVLLISRFTTYAPHMPGLRLNLACHTLIFFKTTALHPAYDSRATLEFPEAS